MKPPPDVASGRRARFQMRGAYFQLTACQSSPEKLRGNARWRGRIFAAPVAIVAQTVQLKFLHKLWLCESHRRQPVDISIPAYRAPGMLSNPTGGSRWIVQSQPAPPTTGNKGWD